MSGPRLLALDLATNVGYAFLQRTYPPSPPRFGTLKLEGTLNNKLAMFQGWLWDVPRLFAPDGIAWERPIITRTDTVALLELLYGLVGIVRAFAGTQHLPWCEVTVDQVKITLCGTKKADKGDMIHAAQEKMKWVVSDDHQADAGAVGLYAYGELWPKKN